MIMRLDQAGDGWQAKPIYRTRQEIRRLVPAPRPFEIEADHTGSEPKITKAYRIFFGLKNQDGTYAVKSITEDGKREYQAIGAKKDLRLSRRPMSSRAASMPLRRFLLHSTRRGTFFCGKTINETSIMHFIIGTIGNKAPGSLIPVFQEGL